MDLKRNKIFFAGLLSCMMFPTAMHAQYDSDTVVVSQSYQEEYPAEQTYAEEQPAYVNADTMQESYEQSERQRSMSAEDWKRLSRGLKYDEAEKKKDEEEKKDRKNKNKRDKKPSSSFFSQKPVQVAAMVIAIGLILLLLYKLAPGLFGTRNIKLKKIQDILQNDLEEEEIRNLDLKDLLKQALAKGDYRLAFRLQYLAVIKQLWQNDLISYRKDSTNFEYLMQLSGTTLYQPFQALTLMFDNAWYGELPIGEVQYREAKPLFETLEALIKGAERSGNEK